MKDMNLRNLFLKMLDFEVIKNFDNENQLPKLFYIVYENLISYFFCPFPL